MLTEINYEAIRAEKMRTSIFYGALAGFVFAFVAWGFDGIQLALAHATYPFAMFILGGIPTILIGAGVAWVVYRSQNLLVAFCLWLATGIIYAWLASHVPMDGISKFITLVNPDLARMVAYPFVLAAQFKSGIAMVAVVIVTLIAGMLEIALVEATSDSGAPVGRWIPAVFWVVLFSLAGLAPENNITQDLTTPVITTNRILQFAIDHQGQTVDRQTVLDLRLRSVDPLKTVWNQPRTLVLSHYDELIYDTVVLINFRDQWASCTALGGWPTNCKLVDKNQLYLK
ncbi:MAG: hypothetical protein PHQ40_16200 [Anaerolineaceae bacterium]|nr:hypothetical protein [Anaerolineaceae bacterium]